MSKTILAEDDSASIDRWHSHFPAVGMT